LKHRFTSASAVKLGALISAMLLLPALQGCAGTPDPTEAPARAATGEDTFITGSRIGRKLKTPSNSVTVKETPAAGSSNSQGGASNP